MGRLIILLLSLLAANAGAQTRFESTVVDAATQEVLPFASVYVKRGTSTITNAVGTFAIDCDSADVLRFSYVGYKTKRVRASGLGNVVLLEPAETVLQELLVVPIGPMLDKISKETQRLIRKYKNKKSNFFYRQTAFSDSTCHEFVEAFLTGSSAVVLRNLQLLTGRYAGLQSDSISPYFFYANFYTFSQIEVTATYAHPTPADDVVPLFRNCHHYYDISYHAISEDSSRVFVIHFEPKEECAGRYAMLAATLYVDETTLHLRRIVGEGRNFRVSMRRKTGKHKYVQTIIPTTFTFQVDLNELHGFPEVQSVFIEDVHEIKGKTETTRSLLYNLGLEQEEETKSRRNIFSSTAEFFAKQYKGPSSPKGKDMEFYGNLHDIIARQGYDPEFWNTNEIIRRTPIEEDVLQLFEQQNLFGIMAPAGTVTK